MAKIFQRIEKNNYAAKGAAGHGFDGWFQTNMGTMAQARAGSLTGNKVMDGYAKAWNLTDPMASLLTRDSNDIANPKRDQTSSIYGLVTHQYVNGNRYSSRDYIQAAVNEA